MKTINIILNLTPFGAQRLNDNIAEIAGKGFVAVPDIKVGTCKTSGLHEIILTFPPEDELFWVAWKIGLYSHIS